MKKYIQAPPFCVQVEFTEGCNLRCTFCGLNSIREPKMHNFKFMTVETAKRTATEMARLRWTSRVEFAMHGEPSMNPQMAELVAAFRTSLPRNQLMMTSNGSGFLKDTFERVQSLFAAGLNVLALDDYENVNIVPKVVERLKEYAKGVPPVYFYPEDGLQHSPHRRHHHRTQMIVIIKDISKADKGSHAVINNHAGFGAPPNDSKMGVRCAKPFRELGIRWDGRIAGCCVDWTGSYKIGDVNKTGLDTLWNSDAFTAMRKKLYRGERDFGPCKGCDHPSYRVGLLPDQLGKKTLPKPTAEDEAIIKKALSRGTFTPLIPRPWMKK